MFFKKKKLVQIEQKPTEINWSNFTDNEIKSYLGNIFQEPVNIATTRLSGGAKDFGSARGIRAYNNHLNALQSWKNTAIDIKLKQIRSQNQWVNVSQSVNSGFSTANLSYYNYQNINYYDCMAIAQDPLMNKILTLLSETPLVNGGEMMNIEKSLADIVVDKLDKLNITKKIINCLRVMFSCGGCLLYLETDDPDLTEPLDLKNYDVRKIKNFIKIDPINIAAVSVNSTEPAKADYMCPSMWYVVGLGNVHASRFLKFEDNVPENLMKPLTMYLGTPLTTLIKQDIANSNLATQGLANLINRCRYLFLKTDDQSYTTGNIKNFLARLKVMSQTQDNFLFTPLKSTEDVSQQTMGLAGFDECCKFFYKCVASKTSIPFDYLFNETSSGLASTGENERKTWNDKVKSIQSNIKHNWEIVLGIVAGSDDGKFKEIHYAFNDIEEPSSNVKADMLTKDLDSAIKLIELGFNAEQIAEWLKKKKYTNLEGIDFEVEKYDPTEFEEQEEPEE